MNLFRLDIVTHKLNLREVTKQNKQKQHTPNSKTILLVQVLRFRKSYFLHIQNHQTTNMFKVDTTLSDRFVLFCVPVNRRVGDKVLTF